MLRNYFLIALRNLFRNSIYSMINIGGLAMGIACALLIFLWVWDEVTYDQSHKNVEQLGRLVLHEAFSDKIVTTGNVPLPLYEYLKTHDTRIKNTCIAHPISRNILTGGAKLIRSDGKAVSHEFLTMFRFPLRQGVAEQVLKDPASIVLTEKLARSLFGDQNPMGQVVRLDNAVDLKVTGILEDLPHNSSFDFSFLVPWRVFASADWIEEKSNWHDNAVQVFVETKTNIDRTELNKALTTLFREKRGGESQSELFIHPLSDWRLRTSFKAGKQDGGLIDYVKAYSWIGVFILVIACFNFMNLATARSERRAREVGVRKCVGSGRRQIITQFLAESVAITAIAYLVALLVVQIALPFYNMLVQKVLFVDYGSPLFWVLSLVFIGVLGILSGSYPALYLSSFNPARVLKGNLGLGRGNATPRKTMVSLQFFLSIFLIAGTAVVYRQISYVKSRDIGYKRENLVSIKANEEMLKNLPEIKRQLMATGVVQSITGSSSPITEVYKHNQLDWPGRASGESLSFSRIMVSYDYTQTMGISVLQGRDFSEGSEADLNGILLNQAAVAAMGVKDPIGMEVRLMPYPMKWHVVGVIDNVIMASPFSNPEPGFFQLIPTWIEDVTLRLETTSPPAEALSRIESIFKKLNPSFPFTYHFVDEEFGKKFGEINIVGTLVTVFAFLAIVITALGLFGLAAYTTERRTKEIGIRQVMGASTLSLIDLFFRDFTKPVIIGFLLATPAAWTVFNDYLSRYSYRIDFSWWIIPAAGFLALVLALLIVCSQVLRVTRDNPIRSLQTE